MTGSEHLLPYIIAFLVAAVFTAVALPLVIRSCSYFNSYDMPNARKVHKAPIPRLGGIVFMPAAALGLCAALYLTGNESHRMEISISTLAMFSGAFMIYMIGILDDIISIKARHKFIIQAISALLMPLCGLLITDLNGIFGLYEIPLWVGYPLTVILIMTIVNAINLIDGIDGLSSGLCILILSAYTYVFAINEYPLIAELNAAIVGALVVFFCFNVFGRVGRMKIFMGDAGSLFLGYVCAYMGIKSLMRPIAPVDCGEEQMLISVTLMLIPTLDVVRVFFQRWLSGRNIFDPDKKHIHHLFMSAGLSMHKALMAIFIMFATICLINYGLWECRFPLPLILLTDVAFYAIVIVFVNNRDKNEAA